MSAQRVKLSTEMQFLQDRLKDGTATLQKFSMKPLAKLDKAMQPRVIHLNMDHVKNLGDILQIQLKLNRDLDPGVLFRDPATGWIGLVDGWHRLKAYQVAKMDYFPAYVIEGTKEEAIEYAAMANQHAMLRRTREDVEKQLNMLFSIPKWWNGVNSAIANHVGVGPQSVQKYRAMYGRANGLSIPAVFLDDRGRRFVRKVTQEDVHAGRIEPPIINRGKYFYSRVAGKTIFLGGGRPEDAKKVLIAKMEGLDRSVEFKRRSLGCEPLIDFLENRDLVVSMICASPKRQSISGMSGHGRTITTAQSSGSEYSVSRAAGDVLLLREFDNPAHRAVVVCYPEDGPEEILDLGRRLGIEFLTPEQLVASIKGDGPDDTQASPAPPAPDEPVGDREPTSDAVEILHRRYFEGKPEMMAMLAEEERAATAELDESDGGRDETGD